MSQLQKRTTDRPKFRLIPREAYWTHPIKIVRHRWSAHGDELPWLAMQHSFSYAGSGVHRVVPRLRAYFSLEPLIGAVVSVVPNVMLQGGLHAPQRHGGSIYAEKFGGAMTWAEYARAAGFFVIITTFPTHHPDSTHAIFGDVVEVMDAVRNIVGFAKNRDQQCCRDAFTFHDPSQP
ncbi:hypothetical protein B0H13DRAFT_2314904 [Mycena leptocephala]|nr:hypothetical protein B0H13DRAFT_2314904 [Mycena leptocephala]